MAADTQSSREIERELEHERAELRETVDELWNRMTFEDAWNRVGQYLRDNRSEYGHTVGRLIREKPVAVGLTLLGVTLLLFGPSTPPPASRRSETAAHRRDRVYGGRDDDAVARPARLERDEAERQSGPRGTPPAPSPTRGVAGAAASQAPHAGSTTEGPASATERKEIPAAAPQGSAGSHGSDIGAKPASSAPGRLDVTSDRGDRSATGADKREDQTMPSQGGSRSQP